MSRAVSKLFSSAARGTELNSLDTARLDTSMAPVVVPGICFGVAFCSLAFALDWFEARDNALGILADAYGLPLLGR